MLLYKTFSHAFSSAAHPLRVCVLGCTHAGTKAIENITKFYPEAKVQVFERNDNISFLSCGIALWVQDVVKKSEGLFYNNPKNLQKLGVETYQQHDVFDVNLKEKNFKAKDLQTGKVQSFDYDKLVITTGSWPIIPPIKGIDSQNVLLCKNYDHAKEIIKRAKESSAETVVVIGAGYIGIEIVEALKDIGKKVILLDKEERMLAKYLDKEFTCMIQKQLKDKGIQLELGQCATEFIDYGHNKVTVKTDKNKLIDANLVIQCIGFRASTDMFKGQLDLLCGDCGPIKVDKYQQTSVKDVFAAGDCSSVFLNHTGKWGYIPLATNAVRQGLLVALNLMGPKVPSPGFQGTSGIKIFDTNYASTGMNFFCDCSEQAQLSQVEITDNYRPEFMPTNEEVKLKLIYNKNNRLLKGGQLASKMDLTQCINIISACIQKGMTIDELAFTDFFFQPHFSKPWHFINTCAQKSFLHQ